MSEEKRHGLPPGFIEKVSRRFDEIEAKERRRIASFGHVRPVIHVEAFGKRMVAVGSVIFSTESSHTVPEFLWDYLLYTFGSGWLAKEERKTGYRRHLVTRWIEHVDEMARREPADVRGHHSIVKDGTVSALLLLAYDLYVLDDHRKLQKEMMERIRRKDDFRGSRYELLVAATFLRAGFDFKFEDEADGRRKHPEFIATHRGTSFKIAVEAKARQRAQIQGAIVEAGVFDLMENAAKKRGTNPYAVFVEVDMPPTDQGTPTWFNEVDETARLVAKNFGSPFDLVVFTNIPHRYGVPGALDPKKHYLAWVPTKSAVSLELVNSLITALTQYGNVPDEFEQPGSNG